MTDREFIQFVFGLAGGNAGVELAGANDGAGGGDNLADGLHGAMGEECAGKKSKDECGGASEVKIMADRVKQRLATVSGATDLEDATA
jgi:hypothetical protein